MQHTLPSTLQQMETGLVFPTKVHTSCTPLDSSELALQENKTPSKLSRQRSSLFVVLSSVPFHQAHQCIAPKRQLQQEQPPSSQCCICRCPDPICTCPSTSGTPNGHIRSSLQSTGLMNKSQGKEESCIITDAFLKFRKRANEENQHEIRVPWCAGRDPWRRRVRWFQRSTPVRSTTLRTQDPTTVQL